MSEYLLRRDKGIWDAFSGRRYLMKAIWKIFKMNATLNNYIEFAEWSYLMCEQILKWSFWHNINTLQDICIKRKEKNHFTLISWSIQWMLRSLTKLILHDKFHAADWFADESSFTTTEKAYLPSSFDCNICIHYQALRDMAIWRTFSRELCNTCCAVHFSFW